MFFERAKSAGMQRLKKSLLRETYAAQNQNTLLLGRIASQQVRSRERITSLADVEFRVSSQWGEDGILDWLVERANIPGNAQSFIEFGVEDYRQSNTRFLLQNRNWRGLILDGSPAMLTTVKDDGLLWAYDLEARPAFITRENINELIRAADFTGEIGLLSIDLDGNDYWVWEALEVVNPILLVCEYNAVFGDVYPISTPYDPAFHRTRAHFSNLYFGASIRALCSLAARKGYRFVGTTTAANDAFFVREDYARRFVDVSLESVLALPSRVRDSLDMRGRPDYVRGLARLGLISELTVINVQSGKSVKLGDLSGIYTEEWLAIMGEGKLDSWDLRWES